MSTTEPTDVGPAAGGDRLVSETDRQQVIALLAAAKTEGRLSAAEADRRILAASQARVFDDLVVLTRDLVTTPHISYALTSAENADRVVCLFSGVSRKGEWQVRQHTTVLVAFGGAELDMSQATFESRDLIIEVFCMFGGVELTVPEGTAIENQVLAVFGGCDQKVSIPDPSAPKVIIKGFVGFGGVEIRNPKRGGRGRRRNRSCG